MMVEARPIRRYVRPVGRFTCLAVDGTAGTLNAMIEFERTSTLPTHRDHPVGWVLFWRGKRVEWIAKGHYRTSNGLELLTSNPDAP
jgi:hypothetical protein